MSDTPKTIRQEWRDMKRERDEARAAVESERESAFMCRDTADSLRKSLVEAERERDAVRAQVAALQDALQRLSHYKIPRYDTDDCHDHADQAEAVITETAETAREALALVEDT